MATEPVMPYVHQFTHIHMYNSVKLRNVSLAQLSWGFIILCNKMFTMGESGLTKAKEVAASIKVKQANTRMDNCIPLKLSDSVAKPMED